MGIENEIKRERGREKNKKGGTENKMRKVRERESYSLRTIE